MKVFIVVQIICISLGILGLVGEVKCVIKACQCNWEPVGRVEVIYTASAITGLGAITEWKDIKDN